MHVLALLLDGFLDLFTSFNCTKDAFSHMQLFQTEQVNLTPVVAVVRHHWELPLSRALLTHVLPTEVAPLAQLSLLEGDLTEAAHSCLDSP